MSQITASSDSISASSGDKPRAEIKPAAFVAPAPPPWKRLNLRIVLLMAIILALPSFIFFQWAREAMTGGIINQGSYFEVNLKAMSSFDMDQYNAQPTDIPAKFRALEGKRVMMDGQMYAPNDAGDGSMRDFTFVYNRAKCCFTGVPLAQHMVQANVNPGCQSYYTDGMARVWGTLHIQFARDKDTNKIHSVYAVDVDKVENLD